MKTNKKSRLHLVCKATPVHTCVAGTVIYPNIHLTTEPNLLTVHLLQSLPNSNSDLGPIESCGSNSFDSKIQGFRTVSTNRNQVQDYKSYSAIIYKRRNMAVMSHL